MYMAANSKRRKNTKEYKYEANVIGYLIQQKRWVPLKNLVGLNHSYRMEQLKNKLKQDERVEIKQWDSKRYSWSWVVRIKPQAQNSENLSDNAGAVERVYS